MLYIVRSEFRWAAHQEDDGSVHVEVLQVEAQQAGDASKGPGEREIVVDPEGQREDMRQVCNGQVDHEDQRLHFLAVVA